MSEQAPEQTPPPVEPDAATAEHQALEQRVAALEAAGQSGSDTADTPASESSQSSSSGFSFELVPTGRTHTVNGVETPILDDAGEPESEWTLFATADGTKVPLLTKPASFVANHKIREQRLAERAKQSG